MSVEVRQFNSATPDRPTAADAVGEPERPLATGELIPQVSALRYRADVANGDAAALANRTASLGRDVYLLHLRKRTQIHERLSVQSILGSLADQGLAWSMLARMLRVSIPAVRKWRLGEGASPENRHRIARLAALLDMLKDQFMIEDPAAWLEIPLEPTRRTIADACAQDRLDLVLDYAAGWITAEQVLNNLDRDWREVEAARYVEVFEAEDGDLALRPIRRT